MMDSIYYKLFQMLIQDREVCSLHSLEDCICKMKDDLYLSYNYFTEEYFIYREFHIDEDDPEDYIVQVFCSKNEFECEEFIKKYFRTESCILSHGGNRVRT
jgi:hypothetical protein